MAVSWIKIEVILPDKPEVIRMAELLGMDDIDAVVGKLIRLWAWADQQTVQGDCVQISSVYIDRLVFCKGFADALRSVGWIKGKDGSLKFVNFERHNGETAKSRAESARRMAKSRSGGKGTDAQLFENNGCGDVALFPQHLAQQIPQPEGDKEFRYRNKGGREIQQSIGEPPPQHPPSPPPDFLKKVMGADGKPLPEFAEFVAWAKDLRPGWNAGKLSRRELELATKAYAELERPLSEVEKIAVAEYLAHEPEKSKKFDYPPDRELFFSIFQEIVQKAMAWFRKTGRKTPAEKEEAKKRAKMLKVRNEEVTARRLARQFGYPPEELIAEIEALRARGESPVLTEEEREKIMKGNFDL